MTLQVFKQSLSAASPPQTGALLTAMWYDAKNDWDKAHEIVQDINTKDASWIHAYLHRKEGDLGNASYWYHRAGKSMPDVSLEKEWEEIVTALL